MRYLFILFFVFFIFAFPLIAKDLPSLLSVANKLKYAEKYEAAEKLYDEVLKIDPNNKEARQGKDDCRLMIEPIIPTQHLLPPVADPEFNKLIKEKENAKTPWEKRRKEIAIERHREKYTGMVYSKYSKEYEKEADTIVNSAVSRIKKGELPDKAYKQAEDELIKLQEKANRSWKGHGPKIVDPALDRLDNYFFGNGLPIPGLINKTYNLQEKLTGADIDNDFINNIDSIIPPFPAHSKYQIGDLKYIKGQFTILKYIAEYEGRTMLSEKPEIMHDLLVLKTDKAGNILDAFHYTLEWTDIPSIDLYRLGKKGINLKPKLNIMELGLINTANKEKLRENGIIKNNKPP